MFYRNNPRAVFEAAVDLESPHEVMVSTIKTIVKSVLGVDKDPEDECWLRARDDELVVSRLTGGITNVLYLVTLGNTDRKLIVRLYGAGTAEFIDRSIENIVFARLSVLNIGPTFYGLFLNGRLEGYLPATALESHEMGSANVFPLIAAAVAEMHQLDFPEIRSPDWLWLKIRNFLALARGPGGWITV